MKLLQQVKQLSIFILPILVSYNSQSQAKLVVNGAKINMANAVYLNTNDVSVSDNSLVSVGQSTIKIAGSTTSAGAIDARNGTAELNGSAAQQLTAGSFTGKTVKSLIINNTSGVIVNDTLNVTEVLTVSNGSLVSQGFLTLKSNDSTTARVAPVTSVATVPISGDVIVERSITPKRAFRFLTAPVNATTTIRDNWMEGVNNPNTTSGNINPVPNFGTHITGSGGNINGFDQTQTNNPSLFTFNNATQAWVAASTTGTQLTAGTAYRIMVRGSRSTNLNSQTPPPSPTTLRAKGALVTGTVVLTAPGSGGTPGMPNLSTANSGYSFIANPYASPVNFLSIDLNDIASTMYIFDPTITGTNGRGGYVSFNRSIGPSGVSNNDTSRIDNNIQSGQSFFVQTSGANPSFTFKETDKASLNRRVFRTPNQISKISLQLLLPGQQMTGGAADGLAAYFSDDFSPSIGDDDSYKFTNQDENIAIVRNGKTLSIEGRKPVTANDTLPLRMWQLTSKNYFLKIALKHFDDNVESYLEDAFLHYSTRLNNETATMVPFTITADSLSVAPERFKIVFKNSGTLLSQQPGIEAYVKNKGVQVEWTTGWDNTDSCIVEKSVNAQQFAAANAVKVKNSAGAASSYNWFDANPVKGDNYYRIKFADQSGQAKYSRVAKVRFETMKGIISVVSNESNSNSLTMNFKNIEKGKYSLGLINNAGQKVYSSSINHQGGSANYTITPKNLLAAGIYHLQVSGENTSENVAVLIQ